MQYFLKSKKSMQKKSLMQKMPKFFFSFFFLGPHLWHMEVPKLGIKSEPQLPAYVTAVATPDP